MNSTDIASDHLSCLIADSTMGWFDPGLPLLTAVLVLFNLTVIAGNTVVIAAVLTTEKLRTVTNTFVLSLALADLLLGVTVLPFSITKQVLSQWPFGEAWCTIWLVLDVWLCTSSILNLCAISLDRYLAIGCSFRYPRLMSPFRAKVLVSVVWMSAFLICFPPLIGWRERSTGPSNGSNSMDELKHLEMHHESPVHSLNYNLTFSWNTENTVVPSHPQMKMGNCSTNDIVISPSNAQCRLNSESGYVVYSALGSFWIPMAIMVTFYWRIYVTAKRTTTALRRGVIVRSVGKQWNTSTMSETLGSNGSIALRVHRGGGGTANYSPAADKLCQRLYESQLGNTSLRCRDSNRWTAATQRGRQCQMRCAGHNTSQTGQRYQTPCTSLDNTHSGQRCQTSSTSPSTVAMNTASRTSRCSSNCPTRREQLHFKGISAGRNRLNFKGKAESFKAEDRDLLSNNSRSHLRRLNKEKKAAKTIGIIVGCFVASWMPFFTVYLMGSFCAGCTPEEVFTIFFWLGYFNSALNPFIYGLCSKDFRNAFSRLLRINRCCPTADRRYS